MRNNSFSISGNTALKTWLLVASLSVIMAFFPIIGLCVSLMFFRQRFAPWLFIAFAFCFGWVYEPQMDLLNHYEQFRHIAGKSLIDQWTDPWTISLGKEVYPVLFKYLIGLISINPNFFSACACAAYTFFFVFGILKPLRPLYVQKMSVAAWLLFFGVIFTVEYYWFLGFRFWSGVFVFTGFYLRYLNSGKVKYLWLTALSLCFHFSLIALCFLILINHYLRCRLKYYYLILIISFIVRFAKIQLVNIIAKLSIFEGFVKETARDEQIQKSVERLSEEFRESGNQFYILREAILFFGAIAAIYILYRKTGKEFIRQNIKLWGFCILTLALANFGYSSLTFYDRFFKIAVLFFYIFSYMWIMKDQRRLSYHSQMQIILLTVLPISYSIITQIIEQRETLFQLKIWFSSIFLQ